MTALAGEASTEKINIGVKRISSGNEDQQSACQQAGENREDQPEDS